MLRTTSGRVRALIHRLWCFSLQSPEFHPLHNVCPQYYVLSEVQMKTIQRRICSIIVISAVKIMIHFPLISPHIDSMGFSQNDREVDEKGDVHALLLFHLQYNVFHGRPFFFLSFIHSWLRFIRKWVTIFSNAMLFCYKNYMEECRSLCKWEENIQVKLQEIGVNVMNWMYLAKVTVITAFKISIS